MKLYLRTAIKESMDAALEAANLPESTIIDEIGAITQFTGNTIMVDGEEVPESVTIDGYHVNLLVVEPLTQEQLSALPIIPEPENPYRIFAK